MWRPSCSAIIGHGCLSPPPTPSPQVILHNVTWSEFSVLSVWSKETASDYGHIHLEIFEPLSSSLSPAIAPSPAPPPLHPADPPDAFPLRPSRRPPSWWHDSPEASPSPCPPPPPPPITGRKFGAPQPTMFPNCMQLSHRYRVRWALDPGRRFVEIGLEAAVDGSHYLGFGWAAPESKGQFMQQADMTIAGMLAPVRGGGGKKGAQWVVRTRVRVGSDR